MMGDRIGREFFSLPISIFSLTLEIFVYSLIYTENMLPSAGSFHKCLYKAMSGLGPKPGTGNSSRSPQGFQKPKPPEASWLPHRVCTGQKLE